MSERVGKKRSNNQLSKTIEAPAEILAALRDESISMT